MTTAPSVTTTDATASPDGQQRCPVCDHDLATHDSVSQRYCLATQARALTRNCICGSWS